MRSIRFPSISFVSSFSTACTSKEGEIGKDDLIGCWEFSNEIVNDKWSYRFEFQENDSAAHIAETFPYIDDSSGFPVVYASIVEIEFGTWSYDADSIYLEDGNGVARLGPKGGTLNSREVLRYRLALPYSIDGSKIRLVLGSDETHKSEYGFSRCEN